jgi:hypothetical protein
MDEDYANTRPFYYIDSEKSVTYDNENARSYGFIIFYRTTWSPQLLQLAVKFNI